MNGEGMLARIAEIISATSPIILCCVRIDAHPLAIDAIKETVTLTPHRVWPEQDMLLGIPIVPKDDLQPGQWQAFDQFGRVMKEGNVLLTSGAPPE